MPTTCLQRIGHMGRSPTIHQDRLPIHSGTRLTTATGKTYYCSYSLTFKNTQASGIHKHSLCNSLQHMHTVQCTHMLAHIPTWTHMYTYPTHTSTWALEHGHLVLISSVCTEVILHSWQNYQQKQLYEHSHGCNKACFHIRENHLWCVT